MENKTPLNQVNEDLNKLGETLSKFESEMGLPKGINKETVDKATELLNMDWYSLKTMDSVDLMILALILTDYSGIVQRIINREKSVIHWCSQRIRKLVFHLLPNIKAYSFEEREASALHDNEFGASLHYKRTEAELRLSRFEGLNYSVKNLADKIESLAKIKNGHSSNAV